MKMRNKGKVHPFSASSSNSFPIRGSGRGSSSNTGDGFSLVKVLPAAILTLVSVLSVEESEVLAYMISRSLKSSAEDKKKQQCAHSSPALFDCDCFHCYTSFWFRWDSSPNRELIHQAIESFEDHLSSKNTAKSKRRDKLGRPRTDKPPPEPSPPRIQAEEDDCPPPPVVRTHKGLARKVLPDVMGIFTSRLWSLWSPNV